MIDTDKYEGHLSDLKELAETIEQHKATYALLKDAPLLLKAYKRLRLVADELYLHIVGEPHMTLDELVAEMPWRNGE